jgi:hypothetical protein
MKKTVLAAAIAVAVLGVPALAMDAVMKVVPQDATMMCRPAMANEKPSAMMGGKPIECKSMAPMMKGGMMKLPATTGLSASQTDAAWRKWVQDALLIQSNQPVGGNG